MVGALDLEGYAKTFVTVALFRGKRVDVTVSGGLATPAELLPEVDMFSRVRFRGT